MAYKILVADDEPSLRSLATACLGLLKSEGYDIQTLEAADGTEALRIISEQAGQGLDLVVSDVNMPGKSGIDVLIEGQNVSPSTKYILLSARMEEYREQIEARGAKTLDKPYDLNDLLTAVKASLPQPTQ
ncbi:response regulator [Candidatus Woesearchaeota archaeon]|nr:response regulator [Candidatus Woesearchaeota archaeon]